MIEKNWHTEFQIVLQFTEKRQLIQARIETGIELSMTSTSFPNLLIILPTGVVSKKLIEHLRMFCSNWIWREDAARSVPKARVTTLNVTTNAARARKSVKHSHTHRKAWESLKTPSSNRAEHTCRNYKNKAYCMLEIPNSWGTVWNFQNTFPSQWQQDNRYNPKKRETVVPQFSYYTINNWMRKPRKIWGNTLSMVSMSFENLFKVRPTGVTSKKDMGHCNKWWNMPVWSWTDEPILPRAKVIVAPMKRSAVNFTEK